MTDFQLRLPKKARSLLTLYGELPATTFGVGGSSPGCRRDAGFDHAQNELKGNASLVLVAREPKP